MKKHRERPLIERTPEEIRQHLAEYFGTEPEKVRVEIRPLGEGRSVGWFLDRPGERECFERWLAARQAEGKYLDKEVSA